MMSSVYFIESCATGAIKIGTSTEVARRLSTLQMCSPTPLELLLVVPGGHADESRLHAAFAGERTSGEWFVGDGHVRAFVEWMQQLSEVDRADVVASGDIPPRAFFDAGAQRERRRIARRRLLRLQRVMLDELGDEAASRLILAARGLPKRAAALIRKAELP